MKVPFRSKKGIAPNTARTSSFGFINPEFAKDNSTFSAGDDPTPDFTEDSPFNGSGADRPYTNQRIDEDGIPELNQTNNTAQPDVEWYQGEDSVTESVRIPVIGVTTRLYPAEDYGSDFPNPRKEKYRDPKDRKTRERTPRDKPSRERYREKIPKERNPRERYRERNRKPRSRNNRNKVPCSRCSAKNEIRKARENKKAVSYVQVQRDKVLQFVKNRDDYTERNVSKNKEDYNELLEGHINDKLTEKQDFEFTLGHNLDTVDRYQNLDSIIGELEAMVDTVQDRGFDRGLEYHDRNLGDYDF